MPAEGPLPEQVLIFIDTYRQREGVPPALSVIATAFQTDIETAKACVDELISLGFLRRFGSQAEDSQVEPQALRR